jgi:hypothetical protein
MGCQHVHEILAVEKKIIEQHIDKHKWCNNIQGENKAICDFAQKFAWLMREIFCTYMCKERSHCPFCFQFKYIFLERISDGEIREYMRYAVEEDEELIRLKLRIVKHNIQSHKWLNKIDTYEGAVKSFLEKFGWLIYEMYKIKKEEENVDRCQ